MPELTGRTVDDVAAAMAAKGYTPAQIAAMRAASAEAAERSRDDPELAAVKADALAVALPRHWRITSYGADGGILDNRRTGRRVLLSVQREWDGEIWLHGSISRADRQYPTYPDLVDLHVLMGRRLAYQVFVPPEEHYTDPVAGVEVLHLWAPLTGPRRTPDFRSKEGTI